MNDGTTGGTPSASKRGIPTTYRGINYRSRVEAKWAAFFDELGWPAEYEPIDLEQYIPDFILSFPSGPVLVEIKSESYLESLYYAANKIDESTWPHEATILGCTPFLEDPAQWGEWRTLGLLRESFTDTCEGRTETVIDWNGADATICGNCGARGFCSNYGSFRNRVCGHYDGDHWRLNWPEPDLRTYWAKATNSVQWKGAA